MIGRFELLRQSGGSVLAAAYGTRGLIFRDKGRDAEAVEWLQKAYAEHETLPNPVLDAVAEDLESEIAALKRLGRLEDTRLAEERLDSVRNTMKEVPHTDRDLNAVGAPTEGAVFVEIDLGSWAESSHTVRGAAKLVNRISEAIESENVGVYAGSATIPESTTLIFYGEDAEALFRVLEPKLVSEPRCAGARVTIRQSGEHREVVLPGRLM